MEDLDHELRGVINKLAGLSGLPPSHGETLQIQNYGIGGKYTCHFDPSWNQEEDRPHNVEELRDPGSVWMSRGASGYGGRRIVTVVSYLADTCVGGDTVFPLVGAEDFELVGIQESCYSVGEEKDDSKDERHGVCFLPRRGNAVLFSSWDAEDANVFRKEAWHCSCPVAGGGGKQRLKLGRQECEVDAIGEEGQKWIVQYWVHEFRYNLYRDAVASWPFLQHGVSSLIKGYNYGGVINVEPLVSSEDVTFTMPVGENMLFDEGVGQAGLGFLPEKISLSGRVGGITGRGGLTVALAIHRVPFENTVKGGRLVLEVAHLKVVISSTVAEAEFASNEFTYLFVSSEYVYALGTDGELVSLQALLEVLPEGNKIDLEVKLTNEGIGGLIIGGLRLYDELLGTELVKNGNFFGWM